MLCHGGHDRARVDTAAEEGAEGDVADQLPGDRPVQAISHFAGELALVDVHLGGRRFPELMNRRGSVAVDQPTAGSKLLDVPVGGPRKGHVEEGQILQHRVGVDAFVSAGQPPDRPRLGGEPQLSFVDLVVEGLDSERIASQEEVSFPAVPDGEGEHAVELVDALRPLFFVQVDDDFRVAMASEGVTAAL